MASRLRRESSTPISFFAFLDIITAVTGILILVTLILATDIGGYAPEPTGDTQVDEALNTILRSQAQVEAENARMRRLIISAANAPAVIELADDVTALRRDVAGYEAKMAAVATRKLTREREQKQEASALGLDDLRARLVALQAALDREQLANDQLTSMLSGLDSQMTTVSKQLAKVKSLHGQSWLRPDARAGGKRPAVFLVSGQAVEFKPLDAQRAPQSWAAHSAEREFRSFSQELDPSSQYVVFLIRPTGIDLAIELMEVARKNGLEIGYDAIAEDLIIHVGLPPVDVSPAGDGTAQPESASPPQVSPLPSTQGQPSPTAPPATASSSSPRSKPTRASNPPQPQSQPPPTPPKSKSWWERLVEIVKGVFGFSKS